MLVRHFLRPTAAHLRHPPSVIARSSVVRSASTLCIHCQHPRSGISFRHSTSVSSRVTACHQVCCSENAYHEKRFYSSGSLPPHIKVVLPALSPTMERGTIVRWTKQEGDQLNEGDLLAEIETDKATMGFETPEEGFLAKIIVPGGSKDVALGTLLCVLVTNQTDVAAFKDYKDDGAAPATAGTAATAPAAASAAAAPTAAAPGKSYPSHVLVKLPALSPTMEKGNIASWAKAEGDEVKEGDVLAQIETDKATMDMECSEEGFLAKILAPAGSKEVPLGGLLCILVPNKADVGAFADFKASAAALAASPTPAAATTSPPRPSVSTPATPAPVAPPLTRPEGRVFASPLARAKAVEKGIDLALVRGTGPDGRVTGKDVDSFVPSAAAAGVSARPAAAAAAAAAPGASYVDIPTSSIRQVIARRLLQSKQTVPHYYLSVDIEMDKVLKLRKDLNQLLEKEKVKLSVNDFVIKAASLACRKVPEANSSWQDTFIRQYNTVDISIAVATDSGLITPIVTSADRKGLATISSEVGVLAEKAKQGKLQPHEFQGGTFTISNLGMFGVKNFSAIINPPQACILAVGSAQSQFVVDKQHEKGFRAATVMSVTMSCDHRVVDGAVGAQWLQHFKQFLENPEMMVL